MIVFKYKLQVCRSQTLELPVGAELLHVDVQHGEICLWAKVDAWAKRENRIFCVAGTGHELPDGELKHVGTVMCGPYVWHVFEMTESGRSHEN